MALASFVAALTKTKPKIPAFHAIDLEAEIAKMLRANTSNLSGVTEFANKATDINTSEVMRAVRQTNPDYDKLASGISNTALSFMRGEIPDDVSNQIIRRSAESASRGGYGGSGVSRNLVARDLGLTSLDLISKGQSSAQSWLAQTNALARPYDVSQQFVSADTALGVAVQDRDAKFQRDYANNMNKAQYSTMSRLAAGGTALDAQATQIMSSL